MEADPPFELPKAGREGGQPSVFVAQAVLEKKIGAIERAEYLRVAKLVDDVGPLRRREILGLKDGVQRAVINHRPQRSVRFGHEEETGRRARIARADPPLVHVVREDGLGVSNFFLAQTADPSSGGHGGALLEVAASVHETEGWQAVWRFEYAREPFQNSLPGCVAPWIRGWHHHHHH